MMFRKTHLFFAILGIFLVLSISFANPPKTNWKLENFEFEDSTKKKKTLLAPLLRQDRFGDPFGVYSGGFRNIYSPFLLKNPKSIKQNISLDPKSQNYNISEKIGSLDFRPASSIPLRDYLNIRSQDMMRYYWGKKRKSPEEDPDSRRIPKIKVPGLLGDLLGGGEIDIKPVGNIVLDFGIKGQNVENPQIPVAQQSNYGLNFDQQIAVNLVGNIGKFIPVNVNWDTKANFQFQNIFKVGYQAKEEDIIQEVKFGNVSMPVNNSLISGAQNLLGIQTRLRFGKLWINAVGSSQRGTAEQMVIRGGGQGRAFEFRADQYEYNRHFFLSQFFRDNFERGLRTIPQITSGVVITRVEIYTTNRNNNTQTLRNVLGTMDLAENVPYRTTNASIGQVKGNVSANETNDLFKNLASNPIVRDVNNVSGEMDNKFGLQKGVDYELLRGARKLTPQEYTFHPNLGYVTLSSQLRNDEILAVSYEYTYNGKVYKVGEMTEDYQGYKDSDVILLKMLKPSTIRTDLPTWNLMMKNIYNLQTTQLERTNFQLRIIYRDDLTGIDNPNLQEGFNTKDKPLVQIFGMDRLNMSNDPQPDGNFDFVDGVTVDAKNGRIVFPNLEPFGKFLQNQFIPESERQLINKYVFSELYRETQADAQLLSSKSKFFIKGSYQATTSNQITLPGVNIAPNSVVVRAGSTVLKEGSDYTVDYSLGRVNLMNQGILSSSKEIVIQYERADLFNFQTRNLFGLDAEYRLSKDIRFTATVMSMNERPNITRLSVGSETATNTVWGLGVNYRSDSRMLTRLIDKLPAVSTKAPSSVVFKGDFAQIIPSTNALISKDGGTAFIDDFEAAEIGYDMTRQPIGNWVLGSTPQQFLPKTKLNPLEYSHKRAKLSWYNVDNTAFYFSVLGRTNPTNITSKDKDNHYVRQIPFGEIFKGKSQQLINNPEISLDLAYFPEERGQYNYNPNLTNEGLLPNPRENFAAITKGVTHDVDFDNINIQYIEFWLLDPFIKGENGQIVSQVNGQEKRINNSTGGDLYFNLGSISEDVIPDGRHTFENGFPANENDKDTVGTAWGVASKKQYLTNAFAAENGARARQDVGLDGMNNDQERQHFQKYLDQVRNRVNPNVFQEIQKDPSNDDFQYYLGSELDQQNAKVLDRYKRFNGLEANSPENAGTASSSTLPDNEDLNRDNTLSDLDAYYEYKVALKPDLSLNTKYITNKVVTTAGSNNEQVTWYQFRIPIREFDKKVGNIEGFKSIRYIRMYMTDWQEPVVLRMVNFRFVGAQWRPFVGNLETAGLNLPSEPYSPNFTVSSINVEQNSPPYIIPPGFIRDVDIASNTNALRNEQSLQLCVTDLKDRDVRSVYKNVNLDLVNYERIKMFLHASSRDAIDGEMTAFLRLGTDFKDNYYEIEVPLQMTRDGATIDTDIWLADNEIDIAISDLIATKVERNATGLSNKVPYSAKKSRFKVTVIGNPDLSTVITMMIGIRNPESPDGREKSVCIWANELRATGFVKRSGWAVNTQLNMQLADLGTLNASLRYTSPFWGGIQDKIGQRTRSHDLTYDISANIKLDKFWLHKIGLSLPLFVSYERLLSTPYFNPLDPDTPLDIAKNTFPLGQQNGDYVSLVQNETVRRSINLTNIRKTKTKQGAKINLWDIENFSMTLAYSDINSRSIQTASYINENTKFGLAYDHTSKIPAYEPFKKSIFLNTPYLKFIKDFNINFVPTNISIRGDIDRRYIRTQLRDANLGTNGILPNFEKSFTFNRLYNIRWGISKNLNIDYQAKAFAIIDEPAGELNTQSKSDSVWKNIKKLGRMKTFDQLISINYKFPLDKFPLTDWIGADAKFSAGYNWVAGAVGISDSLGNMAQNNRSVALNGQFNLDKLYDKSNFLRYAQNPKRQQTVPVAGEARQKRLEDRIKIRVERRDNLKKEMEETIEKAKFDTLFVSDNFFKKFNKKIERFDRKILTLDEQITISISESKQKSIERKIEKFNKKKLKWLNKYKTKSREGFLKDSLEKARFKQDSTLMSVPKIYQQKILKVEDQLKNLSEKLNIVKTKVQERQAAQKDKPAMNTATQAAVNLVLMVKKVNFSYTETNSSLLPGLLSSPKFLGMNEAWNSPGWDFILGGQDPTTKIRLAEQGFLAKSAAVNNSFAQSKSTTLNLRATLEPFKDFRIDLEAKRTSTGTYSEIFKYNQGDNSFNSESARRNGTYAISFFSLRTAFASDDAANNSPLFNQFIQNRGVAKGRLDILNPNGTYDPNSQDVLISSFLAAYSGQNMGSSALNAFPQIPIPNWKLSYDGLSRIESLKPYLKSFQLNHAYSSDYVVGGYTSSLLYGSQFLNLNLNEQDIPLPNIDPKTGKLSPVLVTDLITISEKFSPLVGFTLKTAGNISLTASWNKQRNMSLNMSNAQVTEMYSNDVTLDLGWTKAKFRIPFKIDGKYHTLKNDLTVRMAFTLRDTKSVQRKIVDELQNSTVTAGNLNIQLKPTIAYQVNDWINLQIYYDYQLNAPYISNSFKRSTTAFGVQLRLNLK